MQPPFAQPVTAWDFHERRHRPQVVPPTIACRVCWALTTLAPGRIELVEDRVYHRCPHCSGASRIRAEDAGMLQSTPGVSARHRTWPRPLAARAGFAGVRLLLVTCVVGWLVVTALVIAWLIG